MAAIQDMLGFLRPRSAKNYALFYTALAVIWILFTEYSMTAGLMTEGRALAVVTGILLIVERYWAIEPIAKRRDTLLQFHTWRGKV